MSLTLSTIRYLARLQVKTPISGPILTLGRQMVFGTEPQVRDAICGQGAITSTLSSSTPRGQLIKDLSDREPYSGYTNDRVVFELITGSRNISALDNSAHQDVEVLHDLSQPIPPRLTAQYGLVFDGGTLEHVFEITAALRNCVDLLRPGGQIVHVNPGSGFLDHGYYQLSPQFYLDFYEGQQFTDIECLIAELPSKRTNHTAWRFWYWDRDIPRKRLLSAETICVFFSAKKGAGSGETRDPAQGHMIAQGYRRDDKSFERRPWGLSEVSELAPFE
jgi:SAM-dependent methyltransferase